VEPAPELRHVLLAREHVVDRRGVGEEGGVEALDLLQVVPHRVDLASVVSKWVGETEKNLREALSAAEAAGAVVLFDEGDALFGKRGEVGEAAEAAQVEPWWQRICGEYVVGSAVFVANWVGSRRWGRCT
jgi:ATPase family associated with various cellular activities (AAA)